MSRWWALLLCMLALQAVPGGARADEVTAMLQLGNPERGRLVFAPCRTCHYPQAFMGHNNGPNLHGIFGKVAGKQQDFEYYSQTFREAQFVWTPRLMYAWLESPMKMFPGSSMMSLGEPDSQRRADLIAYLRQASTREP